MENSVSYQVKLEVFEGPLDLLLFLIRKKKIDIHDIPMATITKEYLEYLNTKERINLDREAEFLLIAALLIHIKSQMLLPREKPIEDEQDPRQLLVDRLLDYQKIKAASLLLQEKEEKELKKWKRASIPFQSFEKEMDSLEVSLFSLAESFFTLMKRKEKEEAQIIKGKEFSIEEKIQELLAVFEENSFDYFYEQESFEEAFASFFALLELIKSGIVIALQKSHFQPIKVWLREKTPVKRT
jgi:segregation and condensation protein A